MKIFVSELISNEVAKKTNIPVLPLKSFELLDSPVSTHADMLIFVIDKKIFCYEDYYLNNKKIFDDAESEGYEIERLNINCEKNYPKDVSLNILKIGKTLFANLKHASKEVLKYAIENGYDVVNVKQGYSACSTLVIDDNTAITADKGIYEAIKSVGKDATLISPGGVGIEKYDYGFIGGAGFVLDGAVWFFGDIQKHADFGKISQKIDELKMKIFTIRDGYVFDFGGAKVI